MAAKMQTANNAELKLPATNESEQAAKLSNIMASPSLNAARLQLEFNPKQGLDLEACMNEMKEQFSKLQKGDTTRIEALLMGQAHSLQTIFTRYALKMANSEYLNQLKVSSAVALKAQNQCRQTLVALAEIKNPKRATFIKNQATNQQINLNAKTENPEIISANPANELLCEGSHATMDSRGETAASAANTSMATVENRRS